MSTRSIGGGGGVQDTTHIQVINITGRLKKREEEITEVGKLRHHQEVLEIIIGVMDLIKGLEYIDIMDIVVGKQKEAPVISIGIMKILKVEYLV